MSLARVHWFGRRPSLATPSEGRVPSFDPMDFSPALKTRLLILQPTPFCNIECDYCYLPDRNSTARMSLDTVRLAAERLNDDRLVGAQLGIVWHAGEPLTVPCGFYDEAIGVLHEVLGDRTALSHSIQTNGTLINDSWCALFKRHHIKVGVSVDGPANLHDTHRRTRSGRGTHVRAMRGMQKLREHQIPFHAIAVVTAETFAFKDEFFNFFVQAGVAELGCNFDEAEGAHGESSLSNHEAEHAAFVRRMLELSEGGTVGPRLRELSSAFQLIATPLPKSSWGGRSLPDNAQTSPFALVSVAHNGDFGTFSPELLGQTSYEFNNFVLGNVAANGFLASTKTEPFARLWREVVRGIDSCERTCAYFSFCGGGAPANKLYENGTVASGETLYCRTMLQRPLIEALGCLERRIATNVRAKQVAHHE